MIDNNKLYLCQPNYQDNDINDIVVWLLISKLRQQNK